MTGTPEPEITDAEAAHLRRAIELSHLAAHAGNLPFGAVLTDASGTMIAEGRNSVAACSDVRAHAESAALRAAGAVVGLEALRGSVMYASGEPCAMCASAMYLAGVSRIVFAMPVPRITAALPPERAGLGLRTRDFLALLPERVEVVGPVLEDEAAAAFDRDFG